MTNAEYWVRDLCWAINSPSLFGVSSQLGRLENASLSSWHLNPDEVDSDHLCEYLSQRSIKRTGKYFEWLIVYWIQHIRSCELVGHSLQVSDGNRTIGEIDLLFRDEVGHLTHWELAVKFYLRVETDDTATVEYVGPNINDTLQRKIMRLVDHQLPLSKQAVPDVKIRQAFVKGRIYYPWRSQSQDRNQEALHASEKASSVLAINHLRGHWMRNSDAISVLAAEGIHCRIAEKPYWLANEITDHLESFVLTPAESIGYLKNHFANDERPVSMTGWRSRTSKSPESMSLFIVSDHWPTRKTGTP